MMRGVGAVVVLIACAGTTTPAAADPARVADEVHRAGRYASELEIVEPQGTSGRTLGPGSGDGDPWDEGSETEAQWEDEWQHDGWGDDPQRAAPPAAEREPSAVSDWSRAAPGAALLANALLVVVLLALVAFAIWMVSRFVARPRPSRTPPRQAPGASPEELAVRGARALPDFTRDPDRLAEEQRFGEAIEVLLLLALRRVGWEPDVGGESLTARDVLASLARPDPRRDPLLRIVTLAEGVRFGGAPPTRERYARMKESFAVMTETKPGAEAT